MSEIAVGMQIRITAPLTISKIGTADIEVEYPAGSINKKLYIPKNICEGLKNTEVPSGWISHPVAIGTEKSVTITNAKPGETYRIQDINPKTLSNTTTADKIYVCVCGKEYNKPIGKAQCVRRHNRAKDEYKSK